MPGRLQDKYAVVIGAGQTKGETLGFGRATSLLFAREGAHVLLVDRDRDSAEETREMIEAEGGVASVHQADITQESECRSIASAISHGPGGVDILYNGAVPMVHDQRVRPGVGR